MASSRRPGGHSSSTSASMSWINLAWAVAVFANRFFRRFSFRSDQSGFGHQSGHGNGSALRARVVISGWVWVGGLDISSLGGREREGSTSQPSHSSLVTFVTPCDAFCDASSAFRARQRSVLIAPAERALLSSAPLISNSISAIALSKSSPETPAAIKCFTATAMILMRADRLSDAPALAGHTAAVHRPDAARAGP